MAINFTRPDGSRYSVDVTILTHEFTRKVLAKDIDLRRNADEIQMMLPTVLRMIAKHYAYYLQDQPGEYCSGCQWVAAYGGMEALSQIVAFLEDPNPADVYRKMLEDEEESGVRYNDKH